MLTDLVGPEIDADGEIAPGRNNKEFSQQSYGAHFAEVGVDQDTGEVRLRRMLGVFTAGRVLNEKTARSQAIGGMTFGVGAALQEAMMLDPRFGFYVITTSPNTTCRCTPMFPLSTPFFFLSSMTSPIR